MLIPKGKRDTLLQYLNSTHKIHCGAIPFLGTLPKPNGNEIFVSVYRKPTHTGRYLDFKSRHPIMAKRALVRALMDRTENVCSDPTILANGMEHLSKVLHYNNYPQWVIDKWGISDQSGPLIQPDTGHKVKKQFFVSVPYFPGLSESFKNIFKYTAIQVCFKGVNTLKSLLMHPKDKVSIEQKKDVVYHWECQADGCNSSYIGEMSRALHERVKEHSKSTTSAIFKHFTDHHHPLPSIINCSIIEKDPSQIT